MAPKQTTPDEPRHPTGGMEDDPIAQMLIKDGKPVTRESHIGANWFPAPPDELREDGVDWT